MTFDAKAVVLTKTENGWEKSYKTLKSVDDIKKTFTPHEDNVTEVHLDKYRRVYYSLGFLTDGVEAKILQEEDTHFMASPLLLVYCDDEKPVDITDETLKSIEESIEFY
jgi:hypothetical protein